MIIDMRLFIAIQFDDTILDELSVLQAGMKKCGLKGRYTSRENLHLTCVFIGEYGNPDDVLEAMEEVSFQPFTIKLDGVGNFGDLFWAGTTENPELMRLAARIRKSLSDHQISFDKKKFFPHVTLVRKAEFVNKKAGLPDTELRAEMTVDRIALMKSEHGKHGMIYTVVDEIRTNS